MNVKHIECHQADFLKEASRVSLISRLCTGKVELMKLRGHVLYL
jgi:hypothetical protein